ncbi:MAG: hypothetical protein QOJ19_533 [Acidimicrobiia bacterium]|nr:hypothetical protein [Acidimicrobiia bacterium]
MTVTTAAWRPSIFNDAQAEERSAAEAIRNEPAVVVIDTLDLQMQEMRKLRIVGGIDELLQEPPCWVYYPWRRSIVRLLGPQSFARLRLDRNRNKITSDEQQRLRQQTIAVIGLSVGNVIAHTLALEGLCGELRLADFDTIELSNLNRIPGAVFDLGLNKAVVAARRIAEIDPYLSVVVHPEGADEANFPALLEGVDLVIEECDSLDVKVAVREAARSRRIPVIMETSDRGLLDVERFDLQPDAAVFHGLLDDIRSSDLVGLETRDKVPHVLRILEADQLSPRMAASMAEIDQSVSTWPQLGGDVTLGAATAAAAVRRLGRGEALVSGRTRIDLEAALDRIAQPPRAVVAQEPVSVSTERVPHELPEVLGWAASLAPSGGNTQPWRFEADDTFRIFLAPERTSTMDVAFRGSYVAIGAAMFNARVAAAAHGQLSDAELFPNGGREDLVAELRFRPGVDVDLAELYSAVAQRCTNRNPGNQLSLPADIDSSLREEAAREGGGINVINGSGLGELADLLAESDRLRFLAPQLHREMMSELRWPGRDALEIGIDVRTLALDHTDLAKLEVSRRRDVMDYLSSWEGGRALGDVTRDRVRSSSAIVVVTTPGSTPADFVRGGAALERAWLSAARRGLAVQPVSPVTIYALDAPDFEELAPTGRVDQYRQLSRRFRELAGLAVGESVALVLRVSYAADPPARSERLPLSSVLSLTASSAARG